MKLERRNFILTVLAGTAEFAFLRHFLKESNLNAKIKDQISDKETSTITDKKSPYQIVVNEIYVAKGHDQLMLPIRPKVGDKFYLVIDRESLIHPAFLKSSGHLIDGIREDLELDCLANIEVVYRGNSIGWSVAS